MEKSIGWGIAGLIAGYLVHGLPLVIAVTVLASAAGYTHVRVHHKREFTGRPSQRPKPKRQQKTRSRWW